MEDGIVKENLRNIFKHRRIGSGIKFYKNTCQSSDLIMEFLTTSPTESDRGRNCIIKTYKFSGLRGILSVFAPLM